MKSLANKESEIYFDCGSRVKEIRKDLKLSVGEFIELINYSSEKNWLEIEKGKKELGISFLEKIHQITGASLDWLKYGNPKFDWSYFIKFPLDYLFTPRAPAKFFPIDLKLYSPDAVDDAISQIEVLQPEDIYFAIDYDAEDYTKCASSLLVIVCKEHYWQVFEATNLSFWTWDGDASCIQYIFDFMYKLVKNEELSFAIRGLYLTKNEMNQLLFGKRHPDVIVSQAMRRIHEKKYHPNTRHWVEDIIDINHENPNSKTNYPQWYGEWFVEVQKYLKLFAKLPSITEEKNNDFYFNEDKKELNLSSTSHIVYVEGKLNEDKKELNLSSTLCIVYVEGKLDEIYFSIATKLFNLQHLGLRFYQIGKETKKGTIDGGKGALITFLKCLKKHHDKILLPYRTIVLFDHDVKNTRDEINPDDYRKLQCGIIDVQHVNFKKENKYFNLGIENFLSFSKINNFNEREFYDFSKPEKEQLLKSKLCKWVCEQPEEEQRSILINFKDFLIKLAELK